MRKFTFTKTSIDGVIIAEPAAFTDERGFFMETYQKEDFKAGGINADFVQDNHSKSVKGVLRGLHYQINYPQSKLVRCIKGEVFDVVVDLRKDSPTYGKWEGVILSAENRKQLFIPKGFAHGFLVLSDEAELIYKVDDYYHQNDEGGIMWNDPAIGIKWPISDGTELILSHKDKKHHAFKEICF